jgi:aryl carrier-like protein
MANYIHWFCTSCKGIDLSSSVLLSSYTFDGVYTSVFGTLLYGGTLHVLPQRIVQDPELLLDYILMTEVTFLKITPSYLRLAINSPQFENTFLNASKLALIVIGGEAIFATDLRRIASIRPDIQLMNHYGPTEATVGMCAYPIPSDGLENFISTPVIGGPIFNTQVYILDNFWNLVPHGAIGEVCVSGAGLARGYINNQKLTDERFITNPFITGQRLYRTGDLGRWKPDGSIQLIGRMDDQVKIRGYRIELGEIEETLQRHEAVEGVVVTAVKQEAGDYALAAYIVSAAPLNVQELRTWLADYLPSYMVPAYFVRIDAIPLNASGKINRKQLPAPGELAPTEIATFIAPGNEREVVLAKVWAGVLKTNNVGAQANFYELGGDSIKSIQVASLIKQQGYNLKIEDILRYPVLKEMALRMNTAIRKIDQEAVQGIVPMSPIQLRFFQNPEIPQKHHYNQSVVLQASTKLDKEAVGLCLDELVRHHDALRMVYRKEEGKWVQENKNTDHKSYSFNFFDLRQKANAHEVMLQRCESMQSSINLEVGPLMKVALFRFDDTDKLVLIIHHLVIDGVSWRILLEDFSSLYQQQINGSKLSLPQKTDSFRHWTC